MAASRRILITGVSSQLGGRLAQRLEADGSLETILGVDAEDPRHQLERTEFVRVGTGDGLLRRVLRAARIDTVVDTRMATDSSAGGLRSAGDGLLAPTRDLLAAAGVAGSPVRKLVFTSSARYYGCSGEDPAFFTEDMPATSRPQGPVERAVVEAEAEIASFARARPALIVTRLRPAAIIGGGARGTHLTLLGLPVVPAILGFDPRWQFVHEDDVVGALGHAVGHHLPGPYNVAADGVLALSEVASLLGKPLLSALPPWGTGLAATGLRRLGLQVPIELLRELRFGRGLDNRRLKAAGYSFGQTSRETVQKLRVQQRLRPLLGSGAPAFRYEREVEEFLRWSPSVQGTKPPPAAPGDGEGPC
jgi:UDP-glucose 4-epimerase